MKILGALIVPPLAMMMLLAGCSSRPPVIVNEWSNPAYVAPGFHSFLVGAPAERDSVRRYLEDEFVADLKAAGVEALPSYRYIAAEEKIDEARLKQAARSAGAAALLFARPAKVEEKTDYSYSPVVPSFGVFGDHGGAVWQGGYGGPRVTRYTEYTSEAILYDIGKDEVVWSATVKTTGAENINAAVKSYAQSIVNALKEKQLVGARR
jgi:hypothetical protein